MGQFLKKFAKVLIEQFPGGYLKCCGVRLWILHNAIVASRLACTAYLIVRVPPRHGLFITSVSL